MIISEITINETRGKDLIKLKIIEYRYCYIESSSNEKFRILRLL